MPIKNIDTMFKTGSTSRRVHFT